jgi:rhodanese-related sulfurtransferase
MHGGYMFDIECGASSSLDHNSGALSSVRKALADLRDLEPTDADAVQHIADAERSLRAAALALKDAGAHD